MAQDFVSDQDYYGNASLDSGNSANVLATKYQHTDFHSFLNGFMISYVGEDKIIWRKTLYQIKIIMVMLR